MPSTTTAARKPVACGPLLEMQRRNGAQIAEIGGWLVAVRFPHEPDRAANVLVDRSHWQVHEVNGPGADAALRQTCGESVPVRTIARHTRGEIYRLNTERGLLFGDWGQSLPDDALDVTGGWASIALLGADAPTILNKVAALDLREQSLACGQCCQGPVFGVVTLFGRFANRFELHVAADSARFLWEVLLDAGDEFHLTPAGDDYYRTHAVMGGT